MPNPNPDDTTIFNTSMRDWRYGEYEAVPESESATYQVRMGPNPYGGFTAYFNGDNGHEVSVAFEIDRGLPRILCYDGRQDEVLLSARFGNAGVDLSTNTPITQADDVNAVYATEYFSPLVPEPEAADAV